MALWRAGELRTPETAGRQESALDGEIQLRGPNVFAGYWRREEATRTAFDHGWFKTGDLAKRSTDGYYTLLGRKSDLIISGGFNIYPREKVSPHFSQGGEHGRFRVGTGISQRWRELRKAVERRLFARPGVRNPG